MNANQQNTNDQEIDLGQLSKKMGNIIQSFVDWLFDGLLFVIKNKFIIGGLFVLGVGLGLYMDRKTKVYDHEIIVMSNFESTDYLYSKIEQIDSKIKEEDLVFLGKLGIKNPENLVTIEIDPIVDIYPFINKENERNFEMVKLMAEEGDMSKVLKDNVTSKNYKYHTISFTTKAAIDKSKTVNPLLNYLNDSNYYTLLQKEEIKNLQFKIKSQEETINQINGILNQFSGAAGTQLKSDKLIYYNENTELNKVIEIKTYLVKELGKLKVELQNSDKIVKESSMALNVRDVKFVGNNKKIILPILFIGLFWLFEMFRAFYRRQLAKRNIA